LLREETPDARTTKNQPEASTQARKHEQKTIRRPNSKPRPE
jgi:hypothetical protein